VRGEVLVVVVASARESGSGLDDQDLEVVLVAPEGDPGGETEALREDLDLVAFGENDVLAIAGIEYDVLAGAIRVRLDRSRGRVCSEQQRGGPSCAIPFRPCVHECALPERLHLPPHAPAARGASPSGSPPPSVPVPGDVHNPARPG